MKNSRLADEAIGFDTRLLELELEPDVGTAKIAEMPRCRWGAPEEKSPKWVTFLDGKPHAIYVGGKGGRRGVLTNEGIPGVQMIRFFARRQQARTGAQG